MRGRGAEFYGWLLLLLLVIRMPAQPSLRINEVLASNLVSGADGAGEYDDWIEIYNSSGQHIDLAGYYISDDPAWPTQWQIPGGAPQLTTVPAGGFLLLWADEEPLQGPLHLPFGLNREGDRVILTAPDGLTLIDSLSFPLQYQDISLGRNAAGARRYFAEPTPGAPNGSGYLGVTLPPLLSPPGGIYGGGQSVTMLPGDPATAIRYTLDGHNPDSISAAYGGAVPIAATTAVRARAFKPGYIPGEIPSNLYFIDPSFNLPVLGLIIDPDDLWDSQTGIYVNYNGEGVLWERPAYNQFHRDGQDGFALKSGIRIQGRTSRVRPKKSFRLFYRSGYGQERLEYPLFEDSPVQTFRNLVLRAGYDDDIQMPTGTLLRDPLVSELWAQSGELVSRGNFAILYLNDQYWGIYNLRESINEHFLFDHLGYADLDLIRYLKEAIEVQYGSDTEWMAFNAFIRSSDFSQEPAYQSVLGMIDMDNFLDLQALIVCSAYNSWGWGVSAYRAKDPAGKWRWTIWDMDRAFTELSWNGFTFLNDTTGLEAPNTVAFQLLKNSRFKRDYINRTADFLNRYFLPGRVIGLIDSLAAIISPEIPHEAARWSAPVSRWDANVQELRNFAQVRPGIVRDQLAAYFSLPGTAELTLTAGAGGAVKVNSLPPHRGSWSGTYFRGNPLPLRALPDPGQVFAGWSDPALGGNPEIELELAGDRSLTAYFEPADTSERIELVAPGRMRPGDHLPVVLQVRRPGGPVNSLRSTTALLQSQSALGDSLVKIQKGVGTAEALVTAGSSFTLSVLHQELPSQEKWIEVLSNPPVQSYSGSLGGGVTVWDDSYDRLITADLTIPAGGELVIEPGTRVLLGDKVNMIVEGTLRIRGSREQPVVLMPEQWELPWGGIEFYGSVSEAEYCFFIKGGGDPDKGWAHTGTQPVLFAKAYSELSLDHCYLLYCPGKTLGSHYSRVWVDQSVIAFSFMGGEFHYSELDFRNSYLMNIPNDDGIFADEDNDGFHIDYRYPGTTAPSRIENSFFLTGKDDAIDHYNAWLEVRNCWLEGWMHEGIAASGGDTLRVFNTVALQNQQGFEAGWGSPQLFLDHCVAVNNEVGLRFGDNYSTPSTGKLTATNLVLEGNLDNIKNYVNHLQGPSPGAIAVSFSITNDAEYDTLPGCLSVVPAFDTSYYLLPESPGTGMGTAGRHIGRIDSTMLRYGPVMVNEIMYRSAAAFDSEDWVELYNPNRFPVYLSGWELRDDDNSHRFWLPAGTMLPAGGFRVFCRDTSAFLAVHPGAVNYSGEFDFGLAPGDQVRIFAPSGQLADSVAYDVSAPWPASPNGGGPSLELINPADNSLAVNWAASVVTGGTPGYANSLVGSGGGNAPPPPHRFGLAQNYPNPFNPATAIEYTLATAGPVKLEVYDLLGRKVRTLVDRRQNAGRWKVVWDGRNQQGLPAGSGIYFYRLAAGGQLQVKKMLLVK